MGREHRILAGLQRPTCRSRRVVGMCDDESVNDAPFYVMRFVDGHVCATERRRRRRSTEAARAHVSRSLVDTMAAIHAVDLDAVGLDDLGRHDGLHRAPAASGGTASGTRARPATSPRRRRGPRRPRRPDPRAAGPATLVHGDYRLDNCIVDADGQRRRRARLGDLHARRSARRPRPAAGLLDRPGRRRVGVDRRRPRPRPGSGIGASSSSATPRCPGASSSTSTSTSRSRTGSWRASSKASTRATSAARSASAAPTSSTVQACRSKPPRASPSSCLEALS